MSILISVLITLLVIILVLYRFTLRERHQPLFLLDCFFADRRLGRRWA